MAAAGGSFTRTDQRARRPSAFYPQYLLFALPLLSRLFDKSRKTLPGAFRCSRCVSSIRLVFIRTSGSVRLSAGDLEAALIWVLSKSLGDAVEDYGEGDDPEASHQSSACLKLGNAQQDVGSQPLGTHHGGNNHHSQGHHDGLVDTGHDGGPG